MPDIEFRDLIDSVTVVRSIRTFKGPVRSVRRYVVSKPTTTIIPESLYYRGNIQQLRDGSDAITASEAIRAIIIELLDISNIDWIAIRANRFDIKVSCVCDWDDIHAQIIKIISQHL